MPKHCPPLFLIPDPAAFQRKISKFEGRWKRRWTRFLSVAEAEVRRVYWYAGGGHDTPIHAALAWVATGEKKWAEVAARDLRWMRDQYENTLDVGNQDHDTWIHAAAMTR